MNGACGTKPAPHRLPLLIGDTDTCPTAQGMIDADVMVWAELVPGPFTPGLLAGVARLSLPPFIRELCASADSWFEAYRQKQNGQRDVEAKAIAEMMLARGLQ